MVWCSLHVKVALGWILNLKLLLILSEWLKPPSWEGGPCMVVSATIVWMRVNSECGLCCKHAIKCHEDWNIYNDWFFCAEAAQKNQSLYHVPTYAYTPTLYTFYIHVVIQIDMCHGKLSASYCISSRLFDKTKENVGTICSGRQSYTSIPLIFNCQNIIECTAWDFQNSPCLSLCSHLSIIYFVKQNKLKTNKMFGLMNTFLKQVSRLCKIICLYRKNE